MSLPDAYNLPGVPLATGGMIGLVSANVWSFIAADPDSLWYQLASAAVGSLVFALPKFCQCWKDRRAKVLGEQLAAERTANRKLRDLLKANEGQGSE